jgi:predicted amidohydrolase
LGSDFRIAAAQIVCVRGDVDANIATHAEAMAAAARHGVSLLVFPELSLTGYEPDLAAELAITAGDTRLEALVGIARQHDIEAIVGAPQRHGKEKPKLGAIVITANGVGTSYHKMHLGGSEPAFFSPGDKPCVLAVSGHKVGIAICADSSKPAHAEACAASGADIYATGVFLTAEWYENDVPRLRDHAARYRMLTVMANQAASKGSYMSVGKSAVWSPEGTCLVQASGVENTLLVASRTNDAWQGQAFAL